MRIAVLGGAGFAGGHLSTYFAIRGHEILAVDNLSRPGSELNLSRLAMSGVRLHRGDVRCQEDWTEVVAFGPEAVVDCAAQPSAVAGYRNPRLDFTANTFSVLHALEVCRDLGSAFFLFSTNKVYGQLATAIAAGPCHELETRWQASKPIAESCSLDGGDRSLYGASKVMADLMAQEWGDAFGFPVVINRCSCLAGPWQWGKADQGWVAWWVIAHRLGLPLDYIGFGGRQVRDVLAAEDLCRLIEAQLSDLQQGPEVFNIGGGAENTLSLRECTRLCQQITGETVPIEDVDEPRRADFGWYVSDIAKVQSRYGWAPTSSSDPETLLMSIDDWVCDHSEILRCLFPQAQGESAMVPLDPMFADAKAKQGFRSAMVG